MSSPSNAAQLADEVLAALHRVGDPARAAHDRRYLRTDPATTHLGVSVPAARAVAKDVLRSHPALDRTQLLDVVEALWTRGVHDARAVAVELLVAAVDRLDAGDVDRLPRLLREAATWALVDPLAIGVAGPLLDRHRDADEILDAWASDASLWIRRAALLAHLRGLRSGGGEWPRFARLADRLVDEEEFFIRKAIGWVLRETGRRRPELVADWLGPRIARVSGVTLREAVKPLPPETRAALLARR